MTHDTPFQRKPMQRLLFAVLALFVLGASPVLAQPGQRPPGAQPPAAGEILGTVVDAESSAPVPQASVSVWSAADSVLVAGALARPDGSFRIDGLRPGTYYLRVSMMGYGTRTTTPFTIAPDAPRQNAGSIGLSKSAIVLESLEVTAEEQTAIIAPDRNAYRAREVAPAASTASEVLEHVPSVQVDVDGRVSLRGNENVVVQINGRPAPLRGEQLAGYLRQLPASTLDRVEVIPNPSARYDPEGMAGIINIVLRQNVDLGLSGGLTLAASTADRYTASGNLGYQGGPTTLFLSYGFNSDGRDERGINDRTRLGTAQAPLSFTEQDISGNSDDLGHNLNAVLDYRLGPRDVLSNALMLNLRGEAEESLSAYSELDGTRLLLDAYQRIRDSEQDAWMADYSLAWKRTIQPQRHELTTELRLNRLDEDDHILLFRQTTAGAGRTDAETNDTDARSWQLTAQADYTRPLAQRTRLETGYKGTGRWLDRDFEVMRDATGTGTWVRDELSNALEFDETVNAVYGVVSHGAGQLELQGGLRAEYATRDFALADTDESFPHDYWSLFPSALVAYNLSEQTQVKASYSRRIRRPGTQELNPFPRFFDLQNVFLGNPELDPEYTDAVELGVQHSAQWGTLQLSPFYRRTTNIIRYIIDTDAVVSGRQVTTVSFRNLDTGSSWGADLNGTLRVGQKFNGMAAFNVFKMVTEGTSGEASLSSDAVSWSARAQGTLNVTPRTFLSAAYLYRAPMEVESGRFDAVSFFNVALRQRLRGDRVTLAVRVSDVFNTQRFRLRASDDNVIQLTERAFNSRALHLGLQYTFGRPPRVRQPQQEQEPEGAPNPFGGGQ